MLLRRFCSHSMCQVSAVGTEKVSVSDTIVPQVLKLLLFQHGIKLENDLLAFSPPAVTGAILLFLMAESY